MCRSIRVSKDPGPKDPALVRGSVAWPISTSFWSTGVLEYWSVGVLENRRQDKHLLGMNIDIRAILFPWTSRVSDHDSNTPGSFWIGTNKGEENE